MDIVEATRHYEAWLGKRTVLVKADLARKHTLMHDSLFRFLRATHYRWTQRWPAVCAKAAAAPRVLAVGDLHVENFGTWRDAEARLVWGVNDFDDAAPMPWTSDLLHLAVSALIATHEKALKGDGKDACAAIFEGYAEGLRAPRAAPFVLEEAHPELRTLAMNKNRAAQKFWDKLTGLKTVAPAAAVKRLLLAQLPRDAGSKVRFVHRVAGGGSLGLPRTVAIGILAGSFVAREAKARVPPPQVWLGAAQTSWASWTPAILRGAGRDRDPFVRPEKNWLIRRLAPHCETIKLDDLKGAPIPLVLRAMGREAANIHRADARRREAIRANLRRYSFVAFRDDAERMAADVESDWRTWRSRGE